jgi:hypothetical protein
MKLNSKLQQLCAAAHESWLVGDETGNHGIIVFTESEVGARTSKRILGQSGKDLLNARELAYLAAPRGLDCVIVCGDNDGGNKRVLFEVLERHQETLQRYQLGCEEPSNTVPFDLVLIESISIKILRQVAWEAKPYRLNLYTRRAKKPQSTEFLNYFQAVTNYTISGELQNAFYLNQDTEVSFELALVPYNAAGECCVTFEIPTFKANVYAVEAAKELESFCAEFDIKFDANAFIAKWSERNLFEARRFQRMFGDAHQNWDLVSAELHLEAKRLNGTGGGSILAPPPNCA